MHNIQFGGMTARTVAPFDWLAYLRQWRLELEEVRGGAPRLLPGQGAGESLARRDTLLLPARRPDPRVRG